MPSSSISEQAAVYAREALEQGNLLHAAQAIGRALIVDPHRKDWLAILSQIMDVAPEPLDVVPLKPEGTPVAALAVRAYALFRKKRYHDAVDVLLKANLAVPDVPLLDWAMAWLKKPDAHTTINCVRIGLRFKTLLDELSRVRAAPEGGVALMVRLPPFVKRLRETQVCDSAFLLLCADVMRQVPDLKEAYECVREAHELDPSYATCVAMAKVYADRDDLDRAARWYESALEHRPEDVDVRIMLGDLLWTANQLDASERWFREAAHVAPDDHRATPSLYALSYLVSGNETWKDQLESYLIDNPDNARAREVFDRVSPYFDRWLPEPCEYSYNLVRVMVEKWEAGDDIRIEGMSLTSLEAPSVYLAYDLQMAREGKRGKLKLDVESVPRPDVRKPRVPVTYQLWRYRGTEPLPALTAPPDRAVEAVAQLAVQPYSLQRWLREAAAIAPQFGSGRVRELLAVMVHPPEIPKGFTPWAWVQHIQIAAALIIAKLELAWSGSTRKQALFDVVNGPLDWTTTAGILALTMLAEDEPNTADDIASLFNELLRDAPSGGYVCHLHALVYSYQRLAHISHQERRDLARWRRELERR